MKLKLTPVKDIQVLTVTGEVTPHQFQVLRSGITNLFRTGKNKIVLEFTSAKTLSSAILRDLSILNLLARELSGDIVLSGIDKETKIRVEHLSSPPSIFCFEGREEAIKSFQTPKATLRPQAPIAAPKEDDAPVAAEVNPQARAAIRDSENGELGKVRKELETLRRENQILMEYLRTSLHGQKVPASNDVYEEKIEVLEGQLKDALNKIRELEA